MSLSESPSPAAPAGAEPHDADVAAGAVRKRHHLGHGDSVGPTRRAPIPGHGHGIRVDRPQCLPRVRPRTTDRRRRRAWASPAPCARARPAPSAVVTGRGHRREQEGGGPPSEPHRHTRRPERTCGAPRRNTPTTSVRSGGQCIRFRRRRRRIPGSVPAPERSDPGPLRPGAEGRSVTRTGSGWGAGRRRHGTARRNVPSWRSPNGPRSRTRCHRRPDPQPADRGGLVPAAPGAGSRAA